MTTTKSKLTKAQKVALVAKLNADAKAYFQSVIDLHDQLADLIDAKIKEGRELAVQAENTFWDADGLNPSADYGQLVYVDDIDTVTEELQGAMDGLINARGAVPFRFKKIPGSY